MTKDFIVGLVFLGALVTLILITFLVKGIPSGAGEYLYTVKFDSVSGLVKSYLFRAREKLKKSLKAYLQEDRRHG